MINRIIKFITKKKKEGDCLFCKKKFISERYISYYQGIGFINVADCYCSNKCKMAMSKAIKRCFNRKWLSRQERLAVNSLRYIDF
ncbi:MAG: hypothetical protein AABX65_02565 [Nanoarchaeota archaeon]|mgnify:FL=1